MSAPDPHRRPVDTADARLVADMLDDISTELEATSRPDRRALTGDGPEATENRMVRETQAALARAAARALRGDVHEVRRAARGTADDARRAKEQTRRGRAVRPATEDVPLADLERLARQALAVTGSVVWAQIAVPVLEGTVLEATAGNLAPEVATALARGPRAEVLRHGFPVTVDDAGSDVRWPELHSPSAHAFLVLPLGIWGTLALAATDGVGDAARGVAREIAAHGAALVTQDGAASATRAAARARALVLTAGTLLARQLGIDPFDGLDALLERAASAGSTVLDAARHVLDELAPPGDDTPPRAPEPATLRRAIAFLEEHAAGDVDVADVAAAAGLGVRGLQMTFRRWHSTTPLGHLREIRLARAHQELQASDPRQTTVADVAHRWHFTHPGRFSVTYRRRYGCSPSETLRA
ncbi:helix-turn-helix transcriptional regulator [Actinomycetospora straminea]|uniref:HTH araC/xylS-type domain-containing protein n=1 Tax=Actinomycetospora straminea TaxID=663607 RepID=A0ABP9E8H8_9PSEU|nr:helix-turn-helix transcriptional regulator [Actinomycetospora straminea]MDD7931948.1 helix-turn-helix transcriptional regulator [Actinomycetospora straminea]